MQIKAFSEKLRVPPDTIRYYEKEGLLQPKRLGNGYRHYDEQCGAQLKMIVVLKQLGFSIQEIAQLVELQELEITQKCNADTVALFDKKLILLAQKIEFLQQAVDTLQMTKSLIVDQTYEQNQLQIVQAINQLFNELKVGSYD